MSKIMIAFDVETTGKNADTDQIVEISMCLYEAGNERKYHRLIRPDVAISSGAQKVHGITMEDLKDAPSFSDVADEIYDFLNSADVIVGYNVRFDIRFVEKEFSRIGRTVTLYEKLVVDPYRIWQAMEPRSLEDAHVRFVGSKMENAHSAEADVQAAVRVLRGVRETFNLQEASWEDLAMITTPELTSWIGPTDHVKWEDGRVILGFGKHGGKPIYDIVRDSPDYLRWITGADFPPHVKSVCKGALSGIVEEAFVERIIEFYGPPPPPED